MLTLLLVNAILNNIIKSYYGISGPIHVLGIIGKQVIILYGLAAVIGEFASNKAL